MCQFQQIRFLVVNILTHSHTTIIGSKLNDLYFNANLISLILKIQNLKSKLFDHYPTTTYIPNA